LAVEETCIEDDSYFLSLHGLYSISGLFSIITLISGAFITRAVAASVFSFFSFN
jgi:hypothetical protein